MSKRIAIFDADGLLIKEVPYFTKRYEAEFGIAMPEEETRKFFSEEFQQCVAGKADLKESLAPRLSAWNWRGTVDDLLDYWFKGERELDDRFVQTLRELRRQGIRCYLATNNEKYRMEYLSRELHLETLFDGIFSSCYIGAVKSDKAFWEAVHKRLGEPPKAEVVFWDDFQPNIDAANAFGYEAHVYTGFYGFEQWLREQLSSRG